VGSTYLTSLLNSHPGIHGLQEELAGIKGADKQLAWSRSYLTPPFIGRYKAIGFTVKLIQLADSGSFARLLQEMNCRIIHLSRRNRVKAVVSHINGKRLKDATGKWGLFKEEDRPSAFEIDPVEFDKVLHHREQMDRELESYVDGMQLPKLFVCYEDLLLNRDAFLNRIFSFLEVKPLKVEGATLKITSDDLHDVLLNFNELKARYAGTMYEKMFDEILI
jgi:hypothetical protein